MAHAASDRRARSELFSARPHASPRDCSGNTRRYRLPGQALPVNFAQTPPVAVERMSWGRLASPTGFEGANPGEPSSEPDDQTQKDNDLCVESDDGNPRK